MGRSAGRSFALESIHRWNARRALQRIERVAEKIELDDIKDIGRFRLSDAIREGAGVSSQSVGYTADGDRVCAISAAIASGMSRDYVVKP